MPAEGQDKTHRLCLAIMWEAARQWAKSRAGVRAWGRGVATIADATKWRNTSDNL